VRLVAATKEEPIETPPAEVLEAGVRLEKGPPPVELAGFEIDAPAIVVRPLVVPEVVVVELLALGLPVPVPHPLFAAFLVEIGVAARSEIAGSDVCTVPNGTCRPLVKRRARELPARNPITVAGSPAPIQATDVGVVEASCSASNDDSIGAEDARLCRS